MSIAIGISHVSKQYRLGVINYDMFYKDLQSWMARKLGRKDPHARLDRTAFEKHAGLFWALHDVSFDVEQGERIGIIGVNGSGKSTLLKVISRITAPTEGTIKIRGRTASLLEVGTGFHPELTGRENVYLNGTILGMKRKEISKKMDEIIAFSEIEQFIDTPVKRYSSGMYVRLAFSVAAHLESDILIADEVLSVGDAAFQAKSLGKMEDVSRARGRTILFVSHMLGMVERLCPKCVLLAKGRTVMIGRTGEVIAKYMELLNIPKAQ
jgi:lipopolysaccharide transport system ATP-binding protein